MANNIRPNIRTQKAALKKATILKIALDQFHKRGYEKTSVQSIIDKAEVSKGAFYHHFKSKDEVLECIAQQYLESIEYIIKEIVNNHKCNALTKLQDLIAEILTYRADSPSSRYKLNNVFHYQANLKFRQKLLANTISQLKPYLLALFDQGIKEQSFVIPFPDETAELLIQIIGNQKKEFSQLLLKIEAKKKNKEVIAKKLLFIAHTLQNLLVVPKGLKLDFFQTKLKEYLPKKT